MCTCFEKYFCCCFWKDNPHGNQVSKETDPLLTQTKDSKLQSPLTKGNRNASNGFDSDYDNSIDPTQTAPVTGPQADSVPEVDIKLARKKKTAQVKPAKEKSAAAKSSDESKGTEDKPKGAEDKPKGAEDKPKVAEDKPKGAEDNSKAAEDKQKVAEDKPKGAEDKPKGAEDKSKGAEGTDEKKSKELAFKKFNISELDCIFSDFKTTFDPFVKNRDDLEKSEDSFKKAVQSLGEIHPRASIGEYVSALKMRLKDEKVTVKIKEGALTIYKEGGAIVKGISDAVTAINAMLKLGKDLKAMPLTILKGSEDAVDRAEALNVEGILKREFKSVWDFGKIPKLKKAFSNNVEQVKGAPKMVRDFHRKTKEIILEIYHAFADEEEKKKMEEELAGDDDDESKQEEKDEGEGEKKKKKGTKKESGATGKNESKKEKEKKELHKQLKFESVGLGDIDNMFTSLATTINPFVETREHFQDARESFENAVKTICKFDAKKELKDYIKELKKDAKEGNITIYIDEVDGEIKVKSIQGVKPPKSYRDAVQALKNIKSSGKEAVELVPNVQHGIETCIDRIKQIDPQHDFHGLLKKKTDVFKLPGKIKTFNNNRKKAQEIPGIVKEFCLYVEQLLKDIVEGLTGEQEETEEKKGEKNSEKDEGGDKEDEGGDKEDEGGDKKEEGGDKKDEGSDKEDEGGDKKDEGGDKKDQDCEKDEGGDKEDEGGDKEDEGGDKKDQDGERDEGGDKKDEDGDKKEVDGEKKDEGDDKKGQDGEKDEGGDKKDEDGRKDEDQSSAAKYEPAKKEPDDSGDMEDRESEK